MSERFENPTTVAPVAKPEHTWHDSIAETWHAGLRMVGLETESKHLEPKKLDFSDLLKDSPRVGTHINMDYASKLDSCDGGRFSKALQDPTHIDMSCIRELLKHQQGSDNK